jgi:hypothetical protein
VFSRLVAWIADCGIYPLWAPDGPQQRLDPPAKLNVRAAGAVQKWCAFGGRTALCLPQNPFLSMVRRHVGHPLANFYPFSRVFEEGFNLKYWSPSSAPSQMA